MKLHAFSRPAEYLVGKISTKKGHPVAKLTDESGPPDDILHELAVNACKSANLLQARCENSYLYKRL
jgi:hypothetical protein